MTKVVLYFKPLEVETGDTDFEIFKNFSVNPYLYITAWILELDHIERVNE